MQVPLALRILLISGAGVKKPELLTRIEHHRRFTSNSESGK